MVEEDYSVDLLKDEKSGYDYSSFIGMGARNVLVLITLLCGCVQEFPLETSPSRVTMTYTNPQNCGYNLTKFNCNGETVAIYMAHEGGTKRSFTVLPLGRRNQLTVGIEDSNGDGNLDMITFLHESHLADVFISSNGISWNRAPESFINALRKRERSISAQANGLLKNSL